MMLKLAENPSSIHIMSDYFGTNISRQGLDSLLQLLTWSWYKITTEIWDIPTYNPQETLNKIKHFEKLEYVTCSTLRLIKSCLNHLYPKKAIKKIDESREFVNAIYEVRQMLIAIISYKFNEEGQIRSQALIVPKLNHIISNVLKECCQTFQELFHVFYPTPFLKWEILCTLLSYTKVCYTINTKRRLKSSYYLLTLTQILICCIDSFHISYHIYITWELPKYL